MSTVFLEKLTFVKTNSCYFLNLCYHLPRTNVENVQNRVAYVKCSPDGESPGNEKPAPKGIWQPDLRYRPAPVA